QFLMQIDIKKSLNHSQMNLIMKRAGDLLTYKNS
ncbi:MAG: hypothetical protein ACI8WT_003066, partial [Clostridium sp.]